jgi:phosphoglycolate phosphatase-like HAD superfamily hydrolase
VGSSDDSPHRVEIFQGASRRVARAVGVEYGRTVLVGDGTWDVKLAQQLGWAFIGVGQGEGAERLRVAGAATIVEDFRDATEFLRVLDRCEVPG